MSADEFVHHAAGGGSVKRCRRAAERIEGKPAVGADSKNNDETVQSSVDLTAAEPTTPWSASTIDGGDGDEVEREREAERCCDVWSALSSQGNMCSGLKLHFQS